jgi:hypothetical protein
MLERVIVREAAPQRVFELSHGRKEPIMGGPSVQDFPEALDHLQLRTLAGQWIALHRRELHEYCRDHGASMPRGLVNHDDDMRVLRCGIGPGNGPQVASKAVLQIPLLRGGRLRPFHSPCGQLPSDHVQSTEEGERGMTVQVADQGPVALDAQRSAEGREQGEAGLILAQ